VDVGEFELCWHANVRRVTAYAERHVGADASYDVVSATFLTAWRTWDAVPDPALPWLIATARGHVRNHVRSARRQRGLAEKIALLEASAYSGPDTEASVSERADAIAALAHLSDDDREALLLIAWEGLTYAEAAKVLGCRVSTMRVRVHRARDRLGLDLGSPTNDNVLPTLRSTP
jgi:RNA polymerase sigma factor (sigma-70 family)